MFWGNNILEDGSLSNILINSPLVPEGFASGDEAKMIWTVPRFAELNWIQIKWDFT